MVRFVGYNGEPDAERRGCSDCASLRGYVSLWCVNDEAIEARMTNRPDCIKCHFWEPMPVVPAERPSWWRRLWESEPYADAIRVDLGKKKADRQPQEA